MGSVGELPQWPAPTLIPSRVGPASLWCCAGPLLSQLLQKTGARCQHSPPAGIEGHSSSSQDTHHLGFPRLWPRPWKETSVQCQNAHLSASGCRSLGHQTLTLGKICDVKISAMETKLSSLASHMPSIMGYWEGSRNDSNLRQPDPTPTHPQPRAAAQAHPPLLDPDHFPARYLQGSRDRSKVPKEEEYLKMGTRENGISGYKGEFSSHLEMPQILTLVFKLWSLQGKEGLY